MPRPILEDDDVEVTVRRKSPWGKMSEKLKSVAEPWVSRLSPNPTAVEMTYERAKTDHPDDPRFILDVEVEDRGGGDFHVQVASAEL